MMKAVWSVKFMDWVEEERKYKHVFTSLYGGSRKARKAAIDYMTLSKNCSGVNTHEYSKRFYTITADTGVAHCIISKEVVL